MFKVIVWATDGSSAAEQALPYAKGLAQADGARLVVVHVDEFGVGRGGTYSVNVDGAEVLAAIRNHIEDLKREGLNTTLQASRVSIGGAAHVIAEIAKEEGADLIVAGTRGLGPVSGLLLGSVTHRLVQVAHCPVLVVPPTLASASA
jgi:nucleotide-binding universal stress UspA family protein